MPQSKPEDIRVRQIDKKLQTLKFTLESIIPVYLMLDRKVKGLQSDVKSLESERVSLTQGQLVFDDKIDF